jgi:hypothetical protein
MIDRLGRTRWVARAVFLLASLAGLVACNGGGGDSPLLKGSVRSGNVGLAGYTVSLYASLVDRADGWEFVGLGISDANGEFQISYDLPSERSVLFVQADRARLRARSVTAPTCLQGSSSTSAPPSRRATRLRSSSMPS